MWSSICHRGSCSLYYNYGCKICWTGRGIASSSGKGHVRYHSHCLKPFTSCWLHCFSHSCGFIIVITGTYGGCGLRHITSFSISSYDLQKPVMSTVCDKISSSCVHVSWTPPCVCVYASWWVRVWILIVCEFLPPSQRFTRGYSWPLARNKQLEYSRAVASTSSSSSSSWHHFRPACLQLTFTLLPTAFHCFHGLHLPSFGLFCMLWLTVCWIVMYFRWSLLSDMSSFGSGYLLLVSFNSETFKLKFSPDLTTDILQHESFHSKKRKKLNTWTYE